MRFLRTQERIHHVKLTPLAHLLSAYVIALKQRLRGDNTTTDYSQLLWPAQIVFVEKASNKPLALTAIITDWISRNCRTINSSPELIRYVDTNISAMVEAQGGVERILTTPIPFSYVSLVHHILMIYLITLPFVLVSELGWYASIGVLLIGIAMMGIEQAGLEIEDPFGTGKYYYLK
jgi:putative membrane protein